MPNKRSLFTEKRILNLLNTLLIALIFAITSANSVFAAEEQEEKQYEIEIIVFANTHADNVNAETWEEKPKLPVITNNVALVNSFDLLNDDAIEQLPLFYMELDFASNNAFSKYLARLKKNKNYDVLLHRVWRQTVPQNSSGLPVYITSKSNDSLYQPIEEPGLEAEEESVEIITTEHLDTDNIADNPELLFIAALEEEQQMIEAMILLEEQNTLNPLDPIIPFDENPTIPEPKPVSLSPTGPPQHKIYGTFRLSKSRFMHMSLDFVYRDREKLAEFTVYPPIKLADMEEVEGFPEFISADENSFLIEEGISYEVAENSQINEQSNPSHSLVLEEELVTPEITALPENQEELAPIVDTGEPQDEQTEDFLALEKPPFPGYRLTDSKRVRLSKTYYFDHPMFGIIARVIRYKQPKEEIASIKR